MRPTLVPLAAVLTLLAAAAPAAARAPGAVPLSAAREAVPRVAAQAPSASAAASTHSLTKLKARLKGPMSSAGRSSGALVLDLSNGRTVFRLRAGTRRPPASVEKLYTTSTALLRYGSDATLATTVLGRGSLQGTTWVGDLYLRGGGDPTFGSLGFTRSNYGGGGTTYELARSLREAGIETVDGRILGDDTAWDGFRGVPDSGLSRVSPYVGPLSALAYNRGGSAAYAARQLKVALKGQDVKVQGGTGAGVTPSGVTRLATVESPAMRRLAALTLTPSDNFFAEMLIKGLGARFGDRGSTKAGARVVRSTMSRFGIRASVVDGSGLSRSDRTSPKEVLKLLKGIRSEPEVFAALRAGLPVAGRSGTLRTRMRGTPAAGRCQAKTGTLSGVSALAGYCDSRGGELVGFAFLMTKVSVSGARSLQDRMVSSIARYDAD
jgi:D-alanyl-D-alanine carboxypeptidase/D-alanyl-D-alanine-endopeptidase (penicillin-binding protein 4)